MLYRTVSRLSLAIACCGAPALAYAQDSAPNTTPAPQTTEPPAAAPQDNNAGDIIVTAQRRQERIGDVPMSITALSSDKLASAGVVSTTELAAVTPGLQFPVNGAYAQPTIRGIGTTVTSAGSDPNVAIYIDGVYMPSQVGNIFNFNNVERIEVLKGPQGTLYGRNATGGAINVTTYQPSFTPTAKLSASYGSFDEVRLNAYGSAPISKNLAVSLAALYVDDNGYSRDIVRNVPMSTYDERGVRGKLLFKPNDAFSITLAGDWSRKTDLTGYSLKPLDDNTAQSVTVSHNPRDVALSFTPDFSTESYGGSVTGKLALGDYQLSSITSLRKVTSSTLTDLDRTQVNAQQASFNTAQKTFTQEVTLASGGSGIFTWVGGGFYYHDRADNLNLVTNGARGITGRITTDALAGFAEGTLNLLEMVHLTGGLRYSTEQRRFQATRPTGMPASLDTKVRYNSWTPRVSLRVDLSKSMNVYGTYSNGFKSGTYNISSFSTTPVKPEKVNAYEVGFKYFHRGASLTAAVFDYSYDDIQIQALQITTGLTALTNAARAKIRGFELQGTLPIVTGLTVDAGLAYTDAHYTSFPGALITVPKTTGCGTNPNLPCGNIQTSTDASGKDMIRTPPWMFNVGVNYAGDVAHGKLGVSLNGNYNGGFYWDVNNRLRSSPYFLVNGRISWGPANAPWKVAVWGRNLTNKTYEAYVVDTTQADAVSYARPRSIGVSFELAFN